MPSLRFRTNVAGIIKRADGKILVGERSDVTGAWQFPQGGVKRSERPRSAFSRIAGRAISLSGTTRLSNPRDHTATFFHLDEPKRVTTAKNRFIFSSNSLAWMQISTSRRKSLNLSKFAGLNQTSFRSAGCRDLNKTFTGRFSSIFLELLFLNQAKSPILFQQV